MTEESDPLVAIHDRKRKRDKPDWPFRRRLLPGLNGSRRRRAGSPGPCYRGKKAVSQFRNRLDVGATGSRLLQNLAQERDLTGQTDFFDEAVGPQRRHQSPSSSGGRSCAPAAVVSRRLWVEGAEPGGRGAECVRRGRSGTGRRHRLGARRPGTDLGALRDGDSTRRTRRRPLRFHQENIKFPSRLIGLTPVILTSYWSGPKTDLQLRMCTNSNVNEKEMDMKFATFGTAGNSAAGVIRLDDGRRIRRRFASGSRFRGWVNLDSATTGIDLVLPGGRGSRLRVLVRGGLHRHPGHG